MSSADERFRWKKVTDTTWTTFRVYRTYTGDISYVEGVGFTLTITGAGAPAPTVYSTLRHAKNALRKFLLDK